MEEKVIDVRMLGGFRLSVDGEVKGLGQNNKANFLKLIQLVLLNYEKGISKRELIDGVFGFKDLLDENNSLNNLLHQARTQLKKAGVPGKRYIEGKKGIYYPEKVEGYTFSIDVFRFRELFEKAQHTDIEREQAQYLQEAFDLYQGELLPEFSTDNWVVVESVRLKRYYDQLVQWLGDYYKKMEDYDAYYRVYNQATRSS